MRAASTINDGKNDVGLPESPDTHDTKDERDPEEASEMRNTQNTINHDTKSAHEVKTSVDTRDPMRAVLDVVGLELYFGCSKICHYD